jgi:cell wall-associated NlpC family hydrolase
VGDVGERAWRAAQALVGTPFRLHGRDPRFGLDCVGLIIAAYARAGHAPPGLPDRYRLRGEAAGLAETWLAAAGFGSVSDGVRAGDVVVTQPAPDQTHLLIVAPSESVHAHAGLRRVVLMPRDDFGAGDLNEGERRWRLWS